MGGGGGGEGGREGPEPPANPNSPTALRRALVLPCFWLGLGRVLCVGVCVWGSFGRSSFWRGRPARRLTRYEPLDAVSRLFKAFFFGGLWCTSLCRAALPCECVLVSGLGQPTRHTSALRQPKWGVLCQRARSLSVADPSGGCVCGWGSTRARSTQASRQPLFGFFSPQGREREEGRRGVGVHDILAKKRGLQILVQGVRLMWFFN